MSNYRWLNEMSQSFLEKDYLLPNQTLDQRVDIICNQAEKILGIKGFGKRFKENIQKGWYSLSTPIWANFGSDRGLPISCFGSYIDDTMESILYTQAEVGMMTKFGGGTSAYFGDLRPRGSSIKNNGDSSGSVHFMQLFDKLINVVSQGKIRRGNFAAYLPIDHPDIEEFLNIRHEGNPIQDLSFGVCVPDYWMKEMMAGDKQKRKIWAKVLESRTNTGYPYITFIDNANNNTSDVYKDKNLKIKASNLCVVGDTLILTDIGYLPIQDLENQEVNCWNGEVFSPVFIKKTGMNQKVIKVCFSNYQFIECTEYHKFYVQENYRKIVIKEAKDLKSGDKIIKIKYPIIDSDNQFIDAYTQGFFSGDGYSYNGKNYIHLYHEKLSLLPYLNIKKEITFNQENKRLTVEIPSEYVKFDVPDCHSIKNKIEWLEGLCDSDGTLTSTDNCHSIQIGNINLEFLKRINLMLQTIGVSSKINFAKSEGNRILPDGHGGKKEYFCKDAYRLIIASDGISKLLELGFNPKRLNITLNNPQRSAEQFLTVVEIKDENVEKDVFCGNETKKHTLVFNGIPTGNCNEIYLPSNKDESFVCDLSSMNILYYEEWKDTDAVELLTFFLDAVMEEFIQKASKIQFMERAVNFAKNHRALGIGWIGYHSFLQNKMIPFESIEAKSYNSEIAKTIQQQAYKASEKLAQMFGEPEVLKGYGRRNTTLMAIAPTKSSAFIMGQISEGIEPNKTNYYIKDLAKGKFTIKNVYLEKLLVEKNKNTNDVWDSILKKGGSVQHLDFLSTKEKSVFKTFAEITPKEIIIQAAQRQKYIDQGQSLNLMIHPSVPTKDINQLIIFAWESGIKGLYYQFSVNAAQEFSRNILECSNCES